MSVEDPFFVVKDEVQKAVETSKNLYQRWCELINENRMVVKEELDWTTNELRNSLRSIEWDLEDLEETISIVEKNPKKYRIDEGELRDRKNFVERTKHTVKDMKEHVNNPNSRSRQKADNDESTVRQSLLNNGPSRPQNKYTKLENEIERSNSKFIEDHQAQQQLIIKSQDEEIDRITSGVGVLKNVSRQIGGELDEQAVMLDEFNRDMDRTDSRMDNVMKKMTKVLHLSNDRRQWCAIGVLLLVLIIVIILFFVL